MCGYWRRHPRLSKMIQHFLQIKGEATPPPAGIGSEAMGIEEFAAFIKVTGGKIPGVGIR